MRSGSDCRCLLRHIWAASEPRVARISVTSGRISLCRSFEETLGRARWHGEAAHMSWPGLQQKSWQGSSNVSPHWPGSFCTQWGSHLEFACCLSQEKLALAVCFAEGVRGVLNVN